MSENPLIGADFTERRWSVRMGITSVCLAGLAYRDEDEVRETTSSSRMEMRFCTENDVDVYMWWADDLLVVAFRGSEVKLWDWWHNFLCRPVQRTWAPPLRRLHHGYAMAMDAIYPQVVEALPAEVMTKIRRLRVVGHSKGGAEAQAFCQRWQSGNFAINPLECIANTFGSPRLYYVGLWRQLRELLGFDVEPLPELPYTHYRVVTERDAVPMVPPPVGYRHHGECICSRDDGRITQMGQGAAMWKTRLRHLSSLANPFWKVLLAVGVYKAGMGHKTSVYKKRMMQALRWE